MKKIIAGVLLILVAIFALAPFYAGIKTQEALERFASYIDQAPAYNASWRTYNKGWFKTEAVLDVELNADQAMVAEGMFLSLPLQFDVLHGPWIVEEGLKQGWFSGKVSLVQGQGGTIFEHLEAEGTGPVYQSQLFMSLSGLVDIKDKGLPFVIDLDGQRLKASAYSGEGFVTREGSFRYRANLPQLQLMDGDSDLVSVNNMDLSVHTELQEFDNPLIKPGDFQLAVDSITGTDPEGESVSLKNLVIASSVEMNDQATLADMGIDVGFSEFQGLGESVSHGALEMRYANISVAFLEQYVESTSQMQATNPGAMMGMQLMGLAMSELLPAGPEMHIDNLAFTAKDGSLDFDAHLQFDPQSAATNNPMALINQVNVTSKLKVDRALAEKLLAFTARNQLAAQTFEQGEPLEVTDIDAQAKQDAEMRLNMLVVQGMLKEENGTLSANFEFSNGKAIINDQPIPLPF